MKDNGSQGKEPQSPRPAPVLRGSTLIITNLTKIVGMVIAINEMVVRGTGRESVIAYCALTLIGAEAVEKVFIRAIDHVFMRE
jgi:hypothetical protein